MKLLRFIRSNVSYILAGIGALGLGFALGKGYLIDPFREGNLLKEPVETAEPAGHMGIMSVLPDMNVSWEYDFTKCGHKVDIEPLRNVTGSPFEDIKKAYPNATISKENEKEILISLAIEEYCPDHYLLIANDEQSLSVYQTSIDTLISREVMEIPVSSLNFTEDIRNSLLNGISFSSLEEINAYLEDIES